VFRGLTLKFAGIAVLLMCVAGCTRDQLGLPRIAAEELSPDGSHLAWVKNHLSFDPPAQSLWIRDVRTNEPRRVLLLAEDQDWCDTIVWAADSSAVVFLVQNARAIIYDPQSDRILVDQWLVAHDGSYPSTMCARALSFGVDNRTLIFRECDRKGEGCSDWITLSLTDCTRTPR